jgi:hypothetical protein
MGQRGGGYGELDGCVWEGCNGGLLAIPGNALTSIQFSIRNCRYDQNGACPATIIIGQQVPAVEIVGNTFEAHADASGKWTPCKVSIGTSRWPAKKGGSAVVRQNAFSQPAAGGVPQWPSIEISANIPQANQDVMGNQWWQGGVYADKVRVVQVP